MSTSTSATRPKLRIGAETSPKKPSSMGCIPQHQEHPRFSVLPANPSSTLRFHCSTGSRSQSDPRRIRKTISRNLIIGTTSEKSAQERYPSTIGCLRSPTSHQEKETWMGRTHNAKKLWQMEERPHQMIEELID
uniref:Uncharacterized protein n=1 Tax=Caenorhabditis japonica TaxID=281687 RepID=A0A8R1EIC1_CAEJA